MKQILKNLKPYHYLKESYYGDDNNDDNNDDNDGMSVGTFILIFIFVVIPMIIAQLYIFKNAWRITIPILFGLLILKGIPIIGAGVIICLFVWGGLRESVAPDVIEVLKKHL